MGRAVGVRVAFLPTALWLSLVKMSRLVPTDRDNSRVPFLFSDVRPHENQRDGWVHQSLWLTGLALSSSLISEAQPTAGRYGLWKASSRNVKILVITSRVSVRHSCGQGSGQQDYALKAALSSRKAAWRSLLASSSRFRSSCSAFNSASNLLEQAKAWACREIANRWLGEVRERYGDAGTPKPLRATMQTLDKGLR